MRIKKIYCSEMTTARLYAPWASRFTKHEGFFMAFESEDDFREWMKTR